MRMLKSCLEEVLSLIPDDLEAKQLETEKAKQQKKSLQTSRQLANRIP